MGQTYHIDPADLTPKDLGHGYRLSFQESTRTAQVRAVVKDPNGHIIVRGPVVDRTSAFHSRITVLSEMKKRNFAGLNLSTSTAVPRSLYDTMASVLDDIVEEDEDDEEEDDEEE